VIVALQAAKATTSTDNSTDTNTTTGAN
jgi:hypothetical protein